MKIKRTSKYPVGATWEAVSSDGRRGQIWLQKRDGVNEMWMYDVCYSDGSSDFGNHDWGTSYAVCRNAIPIWNRDGTSLRFKRIK